MKGLMYTLWRRPRVGGTKRWERIGECAIPKPRAIVHYQDRLLGNAMGEVEPNMEYRLRPIPREEHV